MSVFSPGVSCRGPRWASSRTQRRHCCYPECSCCIQPSSEEKAVEEWHQGAVKGALRHLRAVSPSPGLSTGAEILCFLALTCSFSSPETFSPHLPMSAYLPYIFLRTPTWHRAQTFSFSWSITPFPPIFSCLPIPFKSHLLLWYWVVRPICLWQLTPQAVPSVEGKDVEFKKIKK